MEVLWKHHFGIAIRAGSRSMRWNLRVNDNVNADTGYINSWSITF